LVRFPLGPLIQTSTTRTPGVQQKDHGAPGRRRTGTTPVLVLPAGAWRSTAFRRSVRAARRTAQPAKDQAGVHWPGRIRVRASTCTVARRGHPATGDATRRCLHSVVRHSVLVPASEHARVEARLGVVIPGGVGVPDGDAPSASAPWTRTAPASTVRRLLS
jgi:hypothetical protein